MLVWKNWSFDFVDGSDADGNDYILIFMKREYDLNNVIEI